MSVTRVAYAVEGWGEGELWLDGTRLVWHELPHPRAHPHPGGGDTRLPLRATIPAKRARAGNDAVPEVRRLLDRLRAYFAGERVGFDDVELDLDGWTPFQQAVFAALRAVPRGEVVTYGELAALAGHPGAQRAAGTFCAHNRFPVVVPCHRVVSAAGIGSYGAQGVEYKRRLLALEDVAL